MYANMKSAGFSSLLCLGVALFGCHQALASSACVDSISKQISKLGLGSDYDHPTANKLDIPLTSDDLVKASRGYEDASGNPADPSELQRILGLAKADTCLNATLRGDNNIAELFQFSKVVRFEERPGQYRIRNKAERLLQWGQANRLFNKQFKSLFVSCTG